MATFAELRTDISDRAQENFSTTQIDRIINQVINYYRKKHFWFNEGIEIITLNAGDAVVPDFPTDYGQEIQPNAVTIEFSNVRYPLTKYTPLEYDTVWVDGQGLPYAYVYADGEMRLYYIPDQAYTLRLYYLKTYVDLVNDADTNDFTDNAERLIVAKSLADLYGDFREDEVRGAYYLAKANDEFNELMNETNARAATGRVNTENIVDRGYYDYFYGYY